MKLHSFTPEEADELNRNTVPVHFFGSIVVEPDPQTPDQFIPLLQVDTSGRPDVEDVFRVLNTEGLPPERLPPFIYSGGKNPGLIVRFAVSDPVSCAFNISLWWPDDEMPIRLMAASGMLCLVAGDAYREDRRICMEIDQAELARALRLWQFRDEE